MIPLITALVGAGTGAIQHNQKLGEYNRQKELAARTAEWSPWTNMNAGQFMPTQKPNLFGDIVRGATTGLTMGMGGGLGSLGGGSAAELGSAPSSSWGQLAGGMDTQGPTQQAGLFENSISAKPRVGKFSLDKMIG